MCVLATYINLIKVFSEEKISTEKMPPPDTAVGKPIYIFLIGD